MQTCLVPLFLMAVFSLALAQSPVAPAPQVWQMEESGTKAGLRGIDSVDGTVAWASGTEGTVLRTVDGGAHWTKCAVPDGDKDGATLDFRGVQAWDAKTAIVMASGPGELSRLYRTVDGCGTWKLLLKNPDAPDGFFDTLYFPKVQSLHREHEGFGLLLGDPAGGRLVVLETRNGGDSWNRVSASFLDDLGTAPAAFAASNSCISGFGGSTFDIVIGGKAGDLLLRVTYRGKWWTDDESALARSWQKVRLPMAQNSGGSGPFSVAARVVFPVRRQAPRLEDIKLREVVVGGDFTKPNKTEGTAAASSGASIASSITPPHGYRSTVQWSALEKLWITAGTNGSDISRDDGKTWQPLDDGNWNALSLPFIVGPKGRIARLNTSALHKQ